MTVKFFMFPNSTSSKKAKKFLESNNISYTMYNMNRESLTKEHLFEILSHTEYGVDDIISTRSKEYKLLTASGINFDELSLTNLHKLIVDHPTLVKAPIMVKEGLTLVGYNDDEIQALIDREIKKKEFVKVLNRARAMEDREFAETGKVIWNKFSATYSNAI